MKANGSVKVNGNLQGILREGNFHTFLPEIRRNFPLIIMPVRANSAFSKPHTHDFIEFVYVVSGSSRHIHGPLSYPVAAGDCFTVLPGELHTLENQSNLRVISVLFYPDVIGEFQSELCEISGFSDFFYPDHIFRTQKNPPHKLHLTVEQRENVKKLLDTIQAEAESDIPGHKLMARALFIQLTIFICGCFSAASTMSPDSVNTFRVDDPLVCNATAFIENNFVRPISVSDIVDSVHLSVSRISHRFKKTTATTTIEYLNRTRTNFACALLVNSNDTIHQIAAKIGIEDRSYFTRIFTRLIGRSPVEYRRIAQKDKQ